MQSRRGRFTHGDTIIAAIARKQDECAIDAWPNHHPVEDEKALLAMTFTPEQMRTLVDGGGLAVELPATREGHRRFVTIGWHKLAAAGSPEFAVEPMMYIGLVYEIHESVMDTWVSNLDMRDRISFQTESEEEIAQFAARYAAIDAYRKFGDVGAPR